MTADTDDHFLGGFMPNLSVASFDDLLHKAVKTFKLTSLGQVESDKHEAGAEPLSVRPKMCSYNPIAAYQKHTLHYVMKGLGYLPTPLLDGLIRYLNGPTSKQYLHVDAHLRLILAVNSKLKRPLQLTEMAELRKKFAADAVAMQSPKVWQKNHASRLSHIKCFANRNLSTVDWEDKVINNADDGDMTVRCYQARADSTKSNSTKSNNQNPDEVVMLFFHGGGFCIGDVNTHHEFCHTVCAQTGWAVVSMDYRLAPEHPSPAALRDCISAYAWLAENCHTLGASSSRIVMAGDSAGGGLSTLIAQQVITPTETAWLDLGLEGQKTFNLLKKLPHPIAQVPLYPVTDVENDYPSWELYGEGLLLDHADVAVFDAACLENSLLPRQHILNSPMLGNNSQVCPTYVVVAELDVLRDEAFAYAKQLQDFGIEVKIRTVLGAPHGFINLMSVHKGLGCETEHIIEEFSSFVRQLIQKQKSTLSAAA